VNPDLIQEMLALTGDHLLLTGAAIAVSAAVALPAAVGLTRRPRLRRVALNVANIIQAIPSLALFGLLLPLPLIGGIGKRTAIVVLVLYALLPLLRNAVLGIGGVDAAVRESAVAMGMTPRQILWQVELPLAIPAILTGLRIATVTTIGTATIAAAIGGGGLGVFIFRGIATVDMTAVLSGALPAALLAVAADEGIGWIERKLSPAYSPASS
jgi:osmoprotectant transport system permease protein